MKSATIELLQTCPATPMRGWVPRPSYFAKPQPHMRPKLGEIYYQPQARKLWCLLKIDFNGSILRFKSPQELDEFASVLLTNPSAQMLVPGWPRPGLPNKHWLSRLPKNLGSERAKTEFVKFIESNKEVANFRKFYANSPVTYEEREIIIGDLNYYKSI